MFELSKPLEEMDVHELELTRRAWKAQGEQAIQPLLEALSIGWNCKTEREYARDFYYLRSGALTIKVYKGVHHFVPTRQDYFNYISIALTVNGQTVANLAYDYYSQNLKSGSWRNAEHLFARPCDICWLCELESLCNEWAKHDAEGKDQSTKQQRNRLLNILQEGKYG